MVLVSTGQKCSLVLTRTEAGTIKETVQKTAYQSIGYLEVFSKHPSRLEVRTAVSRHMLIDDCGTSAIGALNVTKPTTSLELIPHIGSIS